LQKFLNQEEPVIYTFFPRKLKPFTPAIKQNMVTILAAGQARLPTELTQDTAEFMDWKNV
jgi:hypothetical protein